MPSPTYDLFVEAMTKRRQTMCRHDGYDRELCPVILDHSKGQDALTYQFAGQGKTDLPPGGQ